MENFRRAIGVFINFICNILFIRLVVRFYDCWSSTNTAFCA